MSENQDFTEPPQVFQDSGADENGNQIGEDSNGPVNSEYSIDQVQEPVSSYIAHVDSKEDMFLDASDELKEAGAATELENDDGGEGKEEAAAGQLGGMSNGAQDDGYLVAELERLRFLLEQAVGEKERIQGERDALVREIYVKDDEIEGLNARVMELSVSSEVVERNQHVEVVVERILSALGSVFGQGLLLEDSGYGKIDVLEKSSFLLIEKYHMFLHEIEQLRQTVSMAESDFGLQGNFESVFPAVRDGFLELRRKEAELTEKIVHLEDENRKLLEQVQNENAKVQRMNAELGKTKMELEHEMTRCANTKEKLSLAVTKGKALVQQRDSLKQALADKTSELDRCLVELQNKSSALEAAELSKEELAKSEHLAASLQEALDQKSLIVEAFEYILSQIDVPEELQSVDIVGKARWLVNERNELKGVSLVFYKLKDAISSIDIPESISQSDLESCLTWLKESFYQARDEINMLQDEISRTREAAHNEIEHLSASLLAELQEKVYIQKELDDLGYKYKEIVEKAQQISLEKDRLSASFLAELQEKDYIQKELEELSRKYEMITEKEKQVSLEKEQIVGMLVEGYGITMEDQGGAYESSSNLPMLVDRCLGKIKEQISASVNGTCPDTELLERLQSLLYVRDQELMLCKEILDQDIMVRSQLNDKSNELRMISQELVMLKEEKDTLQKDLERSEEKSAVLREKLSMAVKKGKGLVQDRENLKSLLDEKKSEIENLRLELQQQKSTVTECRDEISILSNDLERIPKLEADLSTMKDQRDQFEKFLSESNSMLQRVMKSIDRIVLPIDSFFEEPVKKVDWLAGYIGKCQNAKTQAEDEFRRVKEEADTLASKLAEAQATIKSMEDALTVAENNTSQFAEEKRELDLGRKNIEQELQKAIEEAYSQSSKFTEATEAKNSLEKALSLAEDKISVLTSEKEEAQATQAASEMGLDKVREELATQTSKLAEAYDTIRSLENALSQAETNVAVLTKQNDNVHVDRASLEMELKEMKDETDTLAGKLADASATIKSLEDALAKVENDFSVLEIEKRSAEQEVSLLNSKLNTCMEELAGTSGSLASRSVELGGHINDLQGILKDESLLSTVKQCFARNLNGLKNLDLTIKNIRGHLLDSCSVGLLNHSVEETAHVAKFLSYDLDSIVDIEVDSGDVNAIDGGDISSCFAKTAEGLQMRDKIISDKLEDFSSFIEESVAALLKELLAIENQIGMTVEQVESLKERVKCMEMCEHEKGMLKNDVAALLSACSDATQMMQFEIKNKLLELSSFPELEKLDRGLLPEVGEFGRNDMAGQEDDSSNCSKIVEKLLASTGRVQTLVKLFESTSEVAASLIQDLQKELKDTRAASEKTEEERDQYQSRVSQLERDVEALHNSFRELKLKLEDYEAKEEKWKEKEMELSSAYNSRVSKLESEAEALHNSFRELKPKLEDYEAKEEKWKEKEMEFSSAYNSRVSKLESEAEALHSSCRELKLKLEDYETKEEKWKEKEMELSSAYNSRVSKLESEAEALHSSYRELKHKLEDYEAKEEKWKEKEMEHSSAYNSLLMREQEIEDPLLSASEVRTLLEKISEIQIPFSDAEVEDPEPHGSVNVKKLFYIVDSVTGLYHQIDLLSCEKEDLQSTLSRQILEIEHLKREIGMNIEDKEEFEKMKGELFELTFGLEKINHVLGGKEFSGDQKSAGVRGLLPIVEKQVIALLLEAESSKSKADELGTKLLGSQKVVDELSTRIKLLEDSLQGRTVQPEIVQQEIVQERSIFEAPSAPSGSEISEIEDAGSLGKSTISPVPSAVQVRTLRKGSTDHLAINVDSESDHLINNEEIDEDKGHVFKSLNASGLIPKQGKLIADRVDGFWVSGGRALSSRPRARLGLITYCLLLHIWLLGTIL
ncbi:hypothetical protein SLEP1_g25503 [Rubroshorea leprosula]|uniref:Uncharacterized protein n=1 Tax=Rubroshorea leprosula TaxID=152421 RepID=A0AAV5JJ91_9ROSI|nr:hypothetical protein SLEP1_g25503 [Rubroshorea leprosula]